MVGSLVGNNGGNKTISFFCCMGRSNAISLLFGIFSFLDEDQLGREGCIVYESWNNGVNPQGHLGCYNLHLQIEHLPCLQI